MNTLARQLATFAVIGVASTLGYAALYLVARGWAPPVVANAAALAITAIGNTAANRRLTFGVRGRENLLRDHAAGLVAFAFALAITSLAASAIEVVATTSKALELGALVAANAVATTVRFALLRLAVTTRETATDRPAEHVQRHATWPPLARGGRARP